MDGTDYTAVQSLTLPPGAYFIVAKVSLAQALNRNAPISCQLDGSTSTRSFGDFTQGGTTDVGAFLPMFLTTDAFLDEETTFTLSCQARPDGGTAWDARIIATEVGTVNYHGVILPPP